jgi:HSP20 family protein
MATNGTTQLPVRRSHALLGLGGLRDDFPGFFGFRRPFGRPWRELVGDEEESPAIDMFEKDGKVIVKAEMPGIKHEDIEVNVSEGQITITGERHHEENVQEAECYRSERTYGRIYRALALPKGCDAQGAVANVKDGVLEVVMPRSSQAASRKVEVKSA